MMKKMLTAAAALLVLGGCNTGRGPSEASGDKMEKVRAASACDTLAEADAVRAAKDPSAWRRVAPGEIGSAVELFRDDWMALIVGRKGELNAMTIGWGGIGMLWNCPVVTVYVSSDRYTHGLMERNDCFVVEAFAEPYRGVLKYLGSHSGRHGDKIAGSGLTVEYTAAGNPIFEQGMLAIECRKIYSASFDPAGFSGDAAERFYAKGTGIHTIYIGEIVNVWRK